MLRLAVASLSSGAAYALLGLCLVLLFRMTGTLNFAQAAI
jgi:branched-chain amino acid transport system permease protein